MLFLNPDGVAVKLEKRWLDTLLVIMFLLGSRAFAAPRMETPFEHSGGRDTPRYAGTVAWLEKLAASSPIISTGTFGVSPQGRSLPVVVADLAGRFTPAEHGERGDHVVLLVEACIHAGESCGKDAGMILLRDLAGDPRSGRRWAGPMRGPPAPPSGPSPFP
jgi:hypothetical protein